MNKYVVHTIATFYQTYYVEVEDPEWAGDSIICDELEPFASEFLGNNILYYEKVDEWPKKDKTYVNGAGYRCKYGKNDKFESWEQLNLWDLAT